MASADPAVKLRLFLNSLGMTTCSFENMLIKSTFFPTASSIETSYIPLKTAIAWQL